MGSLERGWRRCICVASGPSLSDWQVERVTIAQRDGWRVFVTNRTWQRLPNADVLFGADTRFWNKHRAAIAAGFTGECWTGDSRSAKTHRLRHVRVLWEVDRSSGLKAGLSKGLHLRHNGSCGGHIISLAYAMGMQTGILLGYDMQQTGGTKRPGDGLLEGGPIHHHGLHEPGLGNPTPEQLAQWCKRMAILGRDLSTIGVEVVNCSTETALTGFARMPLETALEKFAERAVA